MKRLIIFTLTLLSGVSVTNSQTKSIKAYPNARVEQQLRKLEREWLDADAAGVERIEAEDFTMPVSATARQGLFYLPLACQQAIRQVIAGADRLAVLYDYGCLPPLLGFNVSHAK